MPKILIGEQKNNGLGYNKDLAATLLEGFNHVSYNINGKSDTKLHEPLMSVLVASAAERLRLSGSGRG